MFDSTEQHDLGDRYPSSISTNVVDFYELLHIIPGDNLKPYGNSIRSIETNNQNLLPHTGIERVRSIADNIAYHIPSIKEQIWRGEHVKCF